MVEKLSDYIAKCHVPGTQGKHYGDNNNCMYGWLCSIVALQMGRNVPSVRARRWPYNDQIISWGQHLEFIQLPSVLPESNTVCGL